MKRNKDALDNPYTIEGLKPYSFTTKPKEVEIVSSENKYYTMQEIGKKVTFIKDTLEYVKLYKCALPIMMQLSTPGFQTLLYILQVLEPKKGQVYIYPPDAMEWMNYKTLKSVYKGINELVLLDFITPADTKANSYHINPNYFYNGKRT
jgi:hypothetical protein